MGRVSVRISLWVIRRGKPDAGNHHAVGIEARVLLQQAPEGAHQQARSYHQQYSKGHLGDNEQTPQSMGLYAVTRTSCALSQCANESGFGGLDCWGETKQQAGK